MKYLFAVLAALSLSLAAAGAPGQDQEKEKEKEKPAPARSASPAPAASPAASAPEARPTRAESAGASLRVQVVITRYEGEKKVSSLPYSFIVVSGERRATQLRMGIEVPIPVTTIANASAGSPGIPPPTTSIQYRNVGTSLDCTADVMSDGRYKLNISLDQASIYAAPDRRPSAASAVQTAMADAPMFRSYRSTFNALMRDGQSTQFVAAADPVTGDVSKVDVTVNVVR